MALREYEKRILAEIEHRLTEDAPELARRLETFGAEVPPAARETGRTRWKPWVACGLIAVAAIVIGLLVVLLVVAPSMPRNEPTGPSQAPESVVPGAG